MSAAAAPGKIILCGEHAVVYGRPAIAVPVSQVEARAIVVDSNGGLIIDAPDRGIASRLADLPADDPLAAIVNLTLAKVGRAADSLSAVVAIQSTIPIAGGLGSGAAVSTAIARALASYCGRELGASEISALVFEVEKLHHGTPSGIDNTVIAFGRPVYFVRGPHPPPRPDGHPSPLSSDGERGEGQGARGEVTTFAVPVPFRLVIADTGIASPTKMTVADVRQAREAEPQKYEALFDRCGEIARRARALIESGEPSSLGELLTANHWALREMGVSSPELDRLVDAALDSGALGAKLSGGGRGGNMIALITAETEERVGECLLKAGAKRLITTTVG